MREIRELAGELEKKEIKEERRKKRSRRERKKIGKVCLMREEREV